MEEALFVVENSLRHLAAGNATSRLRERVVGGPDVQVNTMLAADYEQGIHGFKTYTVASGVYRFFVYLYDSESSDKVASIARPVLTSSSSAFAFKPASALAIAASLVVAVFVGTQLPSYEDAGESANGLAIQSSQSATTAIPVQTVSTLSANSSLVTEFASGNEPMSENSELMELDEERQKRLRAYLNEHERMSRFRSNQQLVTYPDPSRP